MSTLWTWPVNMHNALFNSATSLFLVLETTPPCLRRQCVWLFCFLVNSSSSPITLIMTHGSLSVTFESKWMVTQSLPLILLVAIGVVLVGTRAVQFVQRVVFKVLPFGAASDTSLSDVCIGVMITGSHYLYFRTCSSGTLTSRGFFKKAPAFFDDPSNTACGVGRGGAG